MLFDVLGFTVYIKACYTCFSAAGPQDADEHFHSCGLARSVGTEKSEDLAGMHFKS